MFEIKNKELVFLSGNREDAIGVSSNGILEHVYTIDSGLIKSMKIERP